MKPAQPNGYDESCDANAADNEELDGAE